MKWVAQGHSELVVKQDMKAWFVNLKHYCSVFQGKSANRCMNWVCMYECRYVVLGTFFQWKVLLKMYSKEGGWAEIHVLLWDTRRHKALIFVLRLQVIYINSLNKSHLNNFIAGRFYWGGFGFLMPGRSDQCRIQLSTSALLHGLGRLIMPWAVSQPFWLLSYLFNTYF